MPNQPYVVMLGCRAGIDSVKPYQSHVGGYSQGLEVTTKYAVSPVVAQRPAGGSLVTQLHCRACGAAVEVDVPSTGKVLKLRCWGAAAAIGFTGLALFVLSNLPPVPPGGRRDGGWVFLALLSCAAAFVALLAGGMAVFGGESQFVFLNQKGDRHKLFPQGTASSPS